MKQLRWVLLAAVAIGVGGCQETKNFLGQGKRPPDEFAVYSRAPLSLPPNYALRPPGGAAAAPQPADSSPKGSAKDALLGERATLNSGAFAAQPSEAGARSPGLTALLDKTGALRANPDVRAQVDRETSILAKADQSFTERLMFWSTPQAYGTVVDPTKETKRIQQNQALGNPITVGNTPTIERKRRALLEGIF